MKSEIEIRDLLLSVIFFAALLFSACSVKEDPIKDVFTLQYPAVSEIAAGSYLKIPATWNGDTPESYSISSVQLDGVDYTSDFFTIEQETGAFIIRVENTLDVGNYLIGVSCVVNGVTYHFPDAVSVTIMKPIPDGIVVEPSEITAKLSDILNPSEASELPTAKIKSDGSSHVQIQEYILANVYRDGVLANECKDWFDVSEDGVFSIVPGNPDFEVGVYEFDFRLTTYITDENSEDGIFAGALTLKVHSAPTLVQYSPSRMRVEKSLEASTAEPAYKGSYEGLKYAIKSVSPDNNVGITINQATGKLTFPASNDITTGTEYVVSLTVSNDIGSTDFNEAFTFEVIDFIEPITKLAYADVKDTTGLHFVNPVEDVDGEELTYSFVNLPEDLSGLEIDPATGDVTCAKGLELPVREHNVTVRVENVKGHVDATFKITIVANPNKFTYVFWGNDDFVGNNLGLTPIEKYGNQFRLAHASPKMTLSVKQTDIPAGRPVKFEWFKYQSNTSTVEMDEYSGELAISSRSSGSAPVLVGGIARVTVGTGDAAITRNIPVFADLAGVFNGYEITYTPFAIRVNPKTGGVSEIPTVKDADGEDVTGAALDYQTNAKFILRQDPEAEQNSILLNRDSDRVTFLSRPWITYFETLNMKVNLGTPDPISYWKNTADTRDVACGYVDGGDNLRIVINPDKFKDKNGVYADGIMFMTMQFSPSGKNPQDKNTSDRFQVNRALIWFDPDYNPEDYNE